METHKKHADIASISRKFNLYMGNYLKSYHTKVGRIKVFKNKPNHIIKDCVTPIVTYDCKCDVYWEDMKMNGCPFSTSANFVDMWVQNCDRHSIPSCKDTLGYNVICSIINMMLGQHSVDPKDIKIMDLDYIIGGEYVSLATNFDMVNISSEYKKRYDLLMFIKKLGGLRNLALRLSRVNQTLPGQHYCRYTKCNRCKVNIPVPHSMKFSDVFTVYGTEEEVEASANETIRIVCPCCLLPVDFKEEIYGDIVDKALRLVDSYYHTIVGSALKDLEMLIGDGVPLWNAKRLEKIEQINKQIVHKTMAIYKTKPAIVASTIMGEDIAELKRMYEYCNITTSLQGCTANPHYDSHESCLVRSVINLYGIGNTVCLGNGITAYGKEIHNHFHNKHIMSPNACIHHSSCGAKQGTIIVCIRKLQLLSTLTDYSNTFIVIPSNINDNDSITVKSQNGICYIAMGISNDVIEVDEALLTDLYTKDYISIDKRILYKKSLLSNCEVSCFQLIEVKGSIDGLYKTIDQLYVRMPIDSNKTILTDVLGINVSNNYYNIYPSLLRHLCVRCMSDKVSYNEIQSYVIGMMHTKMNTNHQLSILRNIDQETVNIHVGLAYIIARIKYLEMTNNTDFYGLIRVSDISNKLIHTISQGLFKLGTDLIKKAADNIFSLDKLINELDNKYKYKFFKEMSYLLDLVETKSIVKQTDKSYVYVGKYENIIKLNKCRLCNTEHYGKCIATKFNLVENTDDIISIQYTSKVIDKESKRQGTQDKQGKKDTEQRQDGTKQLTLKDVFDVGVEEDINVGNIEGKSDETGYLSFLPQAYIQNNFSGKYKTHEFKPGDVVAKNNYGVFGECRFSITNIMDVPNDHKHDGIDLCMYDAICYQLKSKLPLNEFRQMAGCDGNFSSHDALNFAKKYNFSLLMVLNDKSSLISANFVPGQQLVILVHHDYGNNTGHWNMANVIVNSDINYGIMSDTQYGEIIFDMLYAKYKRLRHVAEFLFVVNEYVRCLSIKETGLFLNKQVLLSSNVSGTKNTMIYNNNKFDDMVQWLFNRHVSRDMVKYIKYILNRTKFTDVEIIKVTNDYSDYISYVHSCIKNYINIVIDTISKCSSAKDEMQNTTICRVTNRVLEMSITGLSKKYYKPGDIVPIKEKSTGNILLSMVVGRVPTNHFNNYILLCESNLTTAQYVPMQSDNQLSSVMLQLIHLLTTDFTNIEYNNTFNTTKVEAGIFGCGKTTMIVKVANDSDLILVPNSDFKKEIKKISNNEKNISVMTHEAFLRTKLTVAGNIYVDEASMLPCYYNIELSRRCNGSVILYGDTHQLSNLGVTALNCIEYDSNLLKMYCNDMIHVKSFRVSQQVVDIAAKIDGIYSNCVGAGATVVKVIPTYPNVSKNVVLDEIKRAKYDTIVCFHNTTNDILSKLGYQSTTVGRVCGRTYNSVLVVQGDFGKGLHGVDTERRRIITALTRAKVQLTWIIISNNKLSTIESTIPVRGAMKDGLEIFMNLPMGECYVVPDILLRQIMDIVIKKSSPKMYVEQLLKYKIFSSYNKKVFDFGTLGKVTVQARKEIVFEGVILLARDMILSYTNVRIRDIMNNVKPNIISSKLAINKIIMIACILENISSDKSSFVIDGLSYSKNYSCGITSGIDVTDELTDAKYCVTYGNMLMKRYSFRYGKSEKIDNLIKWIECDIGTCFWSIIDNDTIAKLADKSWYIRVIDLGIMTVTGGDYGKEYKKTINRYKSIYKNHDLIVNHFATGVASYDKTIYMTNDRAIIVDNYNAIEVSHDECIKAMVNVIVSKGLIAHTTNNKVVLGKTLIGPESQYGPNTQVYNLISYYKGYKESNETSTYDNTIFVSQNIHDVVLEKLTNDRLSISLVSDSTSYATNLMIELGESIGINSITNYNNIVDVCYSGIMRHVLCLSNKYFCSWYRISIPEYLQSLEKLSVVSYLRSVNAYLVNLGDKKIGDTFKDKDIKYISNVGTKVENMSKFNGYIYLGMLPNFTGIACIEEVIQLSQNCILYFTIVSSTVLESMQTLHNCKHMVDDVDSNNYRLDESFINDINTGKTLIVNNRMFKPIIIHSILGYNVVTLLEVHREANCIVKSIAFDNQIRECKLIVLNNSVLKALNTGDLFRLKTFKVNIGLYTKLLRRFSRSDYNITEALKYANGLVAAQVITNKVVDINAGLPMTVVYDTVEYAYYYSSNVISSQYTMLRLFSKLITKYNSGDIDYLIKILNKISVEIVPDIQNKAIGWVNNLVEFLGNNIRYLKEATTQYNNYLKEVTLIDTKMKYKHDIIINNLEQVEKVIDDSSDGSSYSNTESDNESEDNRKNSQVVSHLSDNESMGLNALDNANLKKEDNDDDIVVENVSISNNDDDKVVEQSVVDRAASSSSSSAIDYNEVMDLPSSDHKLKLVSKDQLLRDLAKGIAKKTTIKLVSDKVDKKNNKVIYESDKTNISDAVVPKQDTVECKDGKLKHKNPDIDKNAPLKLSIYLIDKLTSRFENMLKNTTNIKQVLCTALARKKINLSIYIAKLRSMLIMGLLSMCSNNKLGLACGNLLSNYRYGVEMYWDDNVDFMCCVRNITHMHNAIKEHEQKLLKWDIYLRCTLIDAQEGRCLVKYNLLHNGINLVPHNLIDVSYIFKHIGNNFENRPVAMKLVNECDYILVEHNGLLVHVIEKRSELLRAYFNDDFDNKIVIGGYNLIQNAIEDNEVIKCEINMEAGSIVKYRFSVSDYITAYITRIEEEAVRVYQNTIHKYEDLENYKSVFDQPYDLEDDEFYYCMRKLIKLNVTRTSKSMRLIYESTLDKSLRAIFTNDTIAINYIEKHFTQRRILREIGAVIDTNILQMVSKHCDVELIGKVDISYSDDTLVATKSWDYENWVAEKKVNIKKVMSNMEADGVPMFQRYVCLSSFMGITAHYDKDIWWSDTDEYENTNTLIKRIRKTKKCNRVQLQIEQFTYDMNDITVADYIVPDKTVTKRKRKKFVETHNITKPRDEMDALTSIKYVSNDCEHICVVIVTGGAGDITSMVGYGKQLASLGYKLVYIVYKELENKVDKEIASKVLTINWLESNSINMVMSQDRVLDINRLLAIYEDLAVTLTRMKPSLVVYNPWLPFLDYTLAGVKCKEIVYWPAACNDYKIGNELYPMDIGYYTNRKENYKHICEKWNLKILDILMLSYENRLKNNITHVCNMPVEFNKYEIVNIQNVKVNARYANKAYQNIESDKVVDKVMKKYKYTMLFTIGSLLCESSNDYLQDVVDYATKEGYAIIINAINIGQSGYNNTIIYDSATYELRIGNVIDRVYCVKGLNFNKHLSRFNKVVCHAGIGILMDCYRLKVKPYCIAFFGDQHFNAALFNAMGLAIKLECTAVRKVDYNKVESQSSRPSMQLSESIDMVQHDATLEYIRRCLYKKGNNNILPYRLVTLLRENYSLHELTYYAYDCDVNILQVKYDIKNTVDCFIESVNYCKLREPIHNKYLEHYNERRLNYILYLIKHLVATQFVKIAVFGNVMYSMYKVTDTYAYENVLYINDKEDNNIGVLHAVIIDARFKINATIGENVVLNDIVSTKYGASERIDINSSEKMKCVFDTMTENTLSGKIDLLKFGTYIQNLYSHISCEEVNYVNSFYDSSNNAVPLIRRINSDKILTDGFYHYEECIVYVENFNSGAIACLAVPLIGVNLSNIKLYNRIRDTKLLSILHAIYGFDSIDKKLSNNMKVIKVTDDEDTRIVFDQDTADMMRYKRYTICNLPTITKYTVNYDNRKHHYIANCDMVQWRSSFSFIVLDQNINIKTLNQDLDRTTNVAINRVVLYKAHKMVCVEFSTPCRYIGFIVTTSLLSNVIKSKAEIHYVKSSMIVNKNLTKQIVTALERIFVTVTNDILVQMLHIQFEECDLMHNKLNDFLTANNLKEAYNASDHCRSHMGVNTIGVASYLDTHSGLSVTNKDVDELINNGMCILWRKDVAYGIYFSKFNCVFKELRKVKGGNIAEMVISDYDSKMIDNKIMRVTAGKISYVKQQQPFNCNKYKYLVENMCTSFIEYDTFLYNDEHIVSDLEIKNSDLNVIDLSEANEQNTFYGECYTDANYLYNRTYWQLDEPISYSGKLISGDVRFILRKKGTKIIEKEVKKYLCTDTPNDVRPVYPGMLSGTQTTIVDRVLNVKKLRDQEKIAETFGNEQELYDFVDTYFRKDMQYIRRHVTNDIVGLDTNLSMKWLQEHPHPDIKVNEALRETMYNFLNIDMRQINFHEKLESSYKEFEVRTSHVDVSCRPILYNSYTIPLLMIGVFGRLKDRFKALLKDNIIYIDGMSMADINKVLQCESSKVWFFENDSSRQDRQTSKETIEFECMVYRLLGVHEELVKLWFTFHKNWTLKTKTYSVHCEWQRLSGLITTAIGNFITHLRVNMKLIRKYINSFLKYVGVGDDTLIFWKVAMNTEWYGEYTAKYFNFVSKTRTSSVVGNVARLMVHKYDNRLIASPDLLRIYHKYQLTNGEGDVHADMFHCRKMSYLAMLGNINGIREIVDMNNYNIELENRAPIEEIIRVCSVYYGIKEEVVIGAYAELLKMLKSNVVYIKQIKMLQEKEYK